MQEQSKEILDLILALRPAIAEDWARQREKGQRTYAISFHNLDKLLRQTYPKTLSGGTFKTAYIYDRINREGGIRTFRLDRLKAVLRFFYKDMAVPYGWPETTKVLQSFAGGKYAELIKNK